MFEIHVSIVKKCPMTINRQMRAKDRGEHTQIITFIVTLLLHRQAATIRIIKDQCPIVQHKKRTKQAFLAL